MAETLTEDALQDAIVEMAHLFGWTVAHFRGARTKHGYRTPCQYDAQGWPDLFLVHEETGRMAAFEVKIHARRSTMTREQHAWLHRLTRCGVEAQIVTERDYPEHVRDILDTKPRPRP